MREILFRGKRKTGEWIEGSLVVSNGPVNTGRCYILPKFSDIRHGYGYEMGDKIGGFYEVVPETIGQFTGLTDKNGKRIFEGDITRCVCYSLEYIYVVVWDQEEYGFKATNGKKNYSSNFTYLCNCEEIEVVGNIYDNPESLKGGGDSGD